MRRATRIVASCLGLAAGIAGLEHGYFEVLQGNTRPAGLMIVSIGPPCVPAQAWNACEPALTIIPNFLVTGMLALAIGLLMILWSLAFIQRRYGGPVLILLSIALLLFGGGIFPPLLGLIGGATATQINRSLSMRAGPSMRFVARLWPWPLVILMLWLPGQFALGYFFNAGLQRVMGLAVILILAILPLSVYTGFARDAAAHS